MKNRRTLFLIGLLFSLLLPAAQAQTIAKVSCGATHTLFLRSDGSLWATGENYYGQLGIGSDDNSLPYGTNVSQLMVSGGIASIVGGNEDSFFIRTNGALWGVGENISGALGIGYFSSSFPYGTNEPVSITNGVVAAAANTQTLFIKTNGSLWVTGNNSNGQLGNTNFNNVDIPVQIVSNGVVAVSAGGGHSLFLKNDGSLWGMGDNEYGQLGIGFFSGSYPYGTNVPVEIETNGVMAIAAGGGHSLFIETNGSLWAMGYNADGQLGDRSLNNINVPEMIVSNGVAAIAAGGAHSMFIKTNGSLWAMGYNYYGQLGDGTNNSTNQPEEILSNGVVAISAGVGHSAFLKNDGTVWVMGENADGQLGDGTFNNTDQPEQIVVGSPPDFDQITATPLGGGQVQLEFTGLAGTNYTLDRAFTLSPVTWAPLLTNPAGPGGVLLFTNTPVPASNNFWRIREVP